VVINKFGYLVYGAPNKLDFSAVLMHFLTGFDLDSQILINEFHSERLVARSGPAWVFPSRTGCVTNLIYNVSPLRLAKVVPS
jgi:hypothetical protein